MSSFDVATSDLLRLAKTSANSGKALHDVAQMAQGLALPSGAFGHLSDSGDVSASYTELQQRLAHLTQQSAGVLTDVAGGLKAAAKCYRDTDATNATQFTGK